MLTIYGYKRIFSISVDGAIDEMQIEFILFFFYCSEDFFYKLFTYAFGLGIIGSLDIMALNARLLVIPEKSE